MDKISAGKKWADRRRDVQHDLTGIAGRQELEVINAIEPLLEGEASAATTAQTIDRIHIPNIEARDSERFLFGLWGIIIDAAAEFDGIRSKRLADLLIALRDLPDCKDTCGNIVKVGGFAVWRQLPNWSWWFREWAIPSDVLYNTPNGTSTVVVTKHTDGPVTAEDLFNATTFAAHVLASLPDGKFAECGGMHTYADLALEMALELSHDSRTSREYTWQYLILPAATWILIAGQKIHQLCHSDVPEASTGFTTHRQWSRNFCSERWSLWREQMHRLAEPPGVEEKHRGLARRAAIRMDELDSLALSTASRLQSEES